MTTLPTVLATRPASGLYVLDRAAEINVLEQLATRYDLAFFVLGSSQIRSKEEFLDQAARALNFPNYFGKNWDAFADCLSDMSWVDRDGFLIVCTQCQDFAELAADEFGTAIEIFREAVEFWREAGKTFVVLFHGTTGKEWGLPLIRL